MIIQSLKALSSDFVQIVFEDGTEETLAVDLISKYHLHCGADISPDRLSEMTLESESLRARDRALFLLSYRAHSAKELRDKLLHKGFSQSAVEQTISWMTERAYLDDSRFASELAFTYLRKGFGKRRVYSEMVRRGISRDIITLILADLDTDFDNRSSSDDECAASSDRRSVESGAALIRRGIDRYLEKHLKDPADRKETRKVKSALFRKGYSSQEISSALERFLESR